MVTALCAPSMESWWPSVPASSSAGLMVTEEAPRVSSGVSVQVA